MHKCGPLEKNFFHTPLPKKVVKTTHSHLEPLPNMEMLELPPEHDIHGGIATKPLKTTQNHSGASPNTLAWKVGLTYGSITKDSNTKTKICFMDIIEERKGYKMTYKELLYLLYFQRYKCFRTENHKKWLNSVGR